MLHFWTQSKLLLCSLHFFEILLDERNEKVWKSHCFVISRKILIIPKLGKIGHFKAQYHYFKFFSKSVIWVFLKLHLIIFKSVEKLVFQGKFLLYTNWGNGSHFLAQHQHFKTFI